MSLYDTAKDFQPLIAAVVALAAAITAYLSTQAAARKQSETALAVQQRQFEETKVKEEQAHRQRELAAMIRLRMKFELIGVLLTDRLGWIKHVESHCPSVEGQGDVYLILDHLRIWQWFRDARSIVKEGEIYDNKDQDIESLEPTYQVVYHSIHRLVSSYDKLQADAVGLAEARAPKAVYLGHAERAAHQAIKFMKDNDDNLHKRIAELSGQLKIDRNALANMS